VVTDLLARQPSLPTIGLGSEANGHASEIAVSLPRSGGLSNDASARRGQLLSDDAAVEAAVLAADPVRQRSRLPQIEPTALGLFGQQATGRSFVFLVDRSHSMGEAGALVAVEGALRAALAGLQPEHRVQLIAYNEELLYLHRPGPARATPETRRAAEQMLNRLAATRGTAHELALLAGLREETEVLYLLTDAGDPALTAGQIEQIAARARGRTAIHCIHFGLGAAPSEEHFLRQLAAACSGTYTFVNADAAAKSGK
jgi:hypothetical protein